MPTLQTRLGNRRSSIAAASTLAALFVAAILLVPANVARAFTVTPIQLAASGDPGTTVETSFSVYNESTTSQTLYTSAENFEAADETGDPVFVPSTDGVVSWVHMPAFVVAKARTQVDIPVTISIPSGTDPGGYFAGLFASTVPATTGAGQVSLGSRVGTLLLLRVNGNVSQGVSVLEFSTTNKSHWYTSLPIGFYFRFQNSGGDRVQPLGDVIVKNIFGFTSKTIDANRYDGNVLPSSIRRFDSAWLTSGGSNIQDPDATPAPKVGSGFFADTRYEWNNFAFGFYTAHLLLAYNQGSGTQSSTASYMFFVFPWHVLLIALILLVILFFVLRIFVRRYNRYIVSQAQRRR